MITALRHSAVNYSINGIKVSVVVNVLSEISMLKKFFRIIISSMKKVFVFLFLFILLPLSVNAEQFVLACKLNISAVHMQTNQVLRTYVIDRYFIVDTVLEGVYDANNLPLNVHEFTSSTLVFSKRAISFADIVDTRLTYDRNSHKITLNEIYAYASKFDKRAQFVTKGEGTCQEIKINRKPLF